MTDLMPSMDSIQAALAWAFNNPATAVAVLLVGRKLLQRADAIEARQAEVLTAMTQHSLALIEAVQRVEHAATSVLGTHRLTRALIQKYRRDLGDVTAEDEAS